MNHNKPLQTINATNDRILFKSPSRNQSYEVLFLAHLGVDSRTSDDPDVFSLTLKGQHVDKKSRL